MVEERLAACVNILGDAHSIYRWQGQIETATETAALFKTAADRAEPLTARIITLHSYDNPAVTVWPISTSKIGRAHVCTPVTNAPLVCRLQLEQKKETHTHQPRT